MRLRPSRRVVVILAAVAIVLVAIRLALPYAIKRYVNDTLDKIPEYDGHVGDIDLALIRGAYVIKDLSLLKTTGNVPVPLFSAPRIDLSVQWGELFHGAVVGEIVVWKPEVN